MKYARYAFVALLAVSFAVAGTPAGTGNAVDWAKAEKNYIASLKSDNAGVQASAASYIRKYNLCNTLPELKEVLQNSNSEKVKMSVALALVSVCGIDGRTAVEEALQKEESEVLAIFYRSILQGGTTSQN